MNDDCRGTCIAEGQEASLHLQVSSHGGLLLHLLLEAVLPGSTGCLPLSNG